MENLTPFEQAAYDEQFRVRNRVSGTPLGSSFTPDITPTKSDNHILISIIGLVAFGVLLLRV
jgi:hypothetical protein